MCVTMTSSTNNALEVCEWTVIFNFWSYDSLQSVVFFYKAEDGIRDVAVTGVQTCALPIWLVASSSEAMRLLELFELQAQEGPCLDAFRTGEPVKHQNLQAGAGPWPSFSAAALQAGFASALALPLRLREVTLGALNLLSVTRAPMAEADVIVARAFADLATLSITQHRASAEAQRRNERWAAGRTSGVVIERAKGGISERAGIALAGAFARLGAYARNPTPRLPDVARAAVNGTLDPRAWAPPPRP